MNANEIFEKLSGLRLDMIHKFGELTSAENSILWDVSIVLGLTVDQAALLSGYTKEVKLQQTE